MARPPSQELVEGFEDIFQQHFSEEVEEFARQYPEESTSLQINWGDLEQIEPGLASDLITHPSHVMEAAEEALRLYNFPFDVSLGGATIRVTNLSNTTPISDLDSERLNQFVSITGTVDKAYSTESVLQRAVFVCQRCGVETEVPQSMVPGSDFQKPNKCMGCERQGPFKIDPERSEYVDEQRFELRESPVGDKVGQDIDSIIVVSQRDIAGEAEPGDQITVVGKPVPTQPGDYTSASISDKYIQANSIQEAASLAEIELSEEDKRRIVELSERDDVLTRVKDSIAPRIYGQETLKEALALQLFGGVTKRLPDGDRIRGDIHALVVGDTGSAKTKLLESIAEIAPKALQTNGKRTTSAGLTASATRTSNGTSAWELEAGPVVLADQGQLTIDDLDKMHESDRAALREPMEEQTVTSSKGDVNAVLSARTSITAAANPKHGRFDQYEPIGEQVDLSPGLISRFDLIFVEADEPDTETDAEIASHVLQANYVGELHTQAANSEGDSASGAEIDEAAEPVSREIELPLLRKYIAFARRSCYPVLTDAAKDEITEFYTDIRSRGEDEDAAPVPVTARKLEALVRLAEASARLRLSDTVTEKDAMRAVSLTREALRDLGVDPEVGNFDADVVETGATETERDKVLILIGVIDELEEEYDKGAPVEQVVKRCESQGLSPDETERLIEKKKERGEMYMPAADYLRTI